MSTGGRRQHLGPTTQTVVGSCPHSRWRPPGHCSPSSMVSGPHVRSKTSLVLCNSGHRSCSQHPLRYSASTASFFFFCTCFAGQGARQRSRSVLLASAVCGRVGRRSRHRPARSCMTSVAEPIALRVCARQAIASSSCGARIRMRMSCALVHGRARAGAGHARSATATRNAASTRSALGSRKLPLKQAARICRPRAKCKRPRSSIDISSATKQAATGRRHASWRPRSRPKQKLFAAARASMATCGGGERAKRRAGQRAPSVLRRATPERELIWIHVDGNQSGRGARLGATASTTPS